MNRLAKVLPFVLLFNVLIGANCVATENKNDANDRQSSDEEQGSDEKQNTKKNDPNLPVHQKRIGGIRSTKSMPLADKYEIRKGPGPEHGADPHGDDLHDEKHFDPYGGTTGSNDDPYNGRTSNNNEHPNRPY